MSRDRAPRVACVVAWVLTAALLASCTGRSDRRDGQAADAAVIVASFNFPESMLLGEIYAQAIEAAGVPVRRELALGPRELVQPALLGGLVDVVPEYLGTALAYVEPAAAVVGSDTEALHRGLAGALAGRGAQVLDAATAQNQNGLAVTRATAERHRLSTISDLASLAGGLTLGGPPECPQRRYCLEAWTQVYGLHFAGFLPLANEHQRVTALTEEVVDVAVMFTTDGRLAAGDLVLLRDDRDAQPVDNVVPVVSSRSVERYGQRLVDALNRVSSRLTSNGLVFLNWRVDVAGNDMATEARGWLERQSLVGRPR